MTAHCPIRVMDWPEQTPCLSIDHESYLDKRKPNTDGWLVSSDPRSCLGHSGEKRCGSVNWSPPGSLRQSTGNDQLSNLRSKRRKTFSTLIVAQWSTPLLHRVTKGVTGVSSSSLHVFCGPMDKASDCVPSVHIQPEWELSIFLADRQTDSQWVLGSGLRRDYPLSLILFVIYIDWISRRSGGGQRLIRGPQNWLSAFCRWFCWLHHTGTFRTHWPGLQLDAKRTE